ncbi:hypothetical protein [Methylobacterium sp. Gmos1]
MTTTTTAQTKPQVDKLADAAPDMAAILREIVEQHGAKLPVDVASRAMAALIKAGAV